MKKMMTAALLLAAPLAAQEPARTITYDQAVEIALQQSASVRLAANAVATDQATLRQQRMQFLPSLSLSTSTSRNLGRNFDQSEGRIVNETSQSVNAGLSSSVTLFDGMRNLAELRAARLSEEAGTQVQRVDAPGRVPRVARLMALAIRYDQLLREGVVQSQTELAHLARVTQPRMTQIMNLLHLAPDIQEELLSLPRVTQGKDQITERDLRPIAAEVDWRNQRDMWRGLHRGASLRDSKHIGSCHLC